jgi:phosphoesterase RecJ-like protein
MELPLHKVEELGAAYSDSEGMADVTITVAGVEVGMLIKHTAQETHFSLRSKGTYDVGAMAKQVAGGGGHSNAAGCTIYEPIKSALPRMLAIITRNMD